MANAGITVHIGADADMAQAVADINRVADAVNEAQRRTARLSRTQKALHQQARETRTEAFKRLSPEQQMNRLLERRERITRFLARAGDNELRRSKLLLALRQNEARIAGAQQARGGLARAASGAKGMIGAAAIGGLAGRAAGMFGIGLGGAAATAGVKAILDNATDIRRASDSIGLSTEMIQEWRIAAVGMGKGTNQADIALQRFSRRIGELQQGRGELKNLAEQIGVNVADSDGNFKSAEALLGEFADKIKNARTEQEQLAIGFKLFDSEGAAFVSLLKDGAEGLERVRKESRETGSVLSNETVQQLAAIGDEFTVMGLRIGAFFAEVALDVARMIRRMKVNLQHEIGGAAAFWGALFGGASINDAVRIMEGVQEKVLQNEIEWDRKIQDKINARKMLPSVDAPGAEAEAEGNRSRSRISADQLARIGGFRGGAERAVMVAQRQLAEMKQLNREIKSGVLKVEIQ